MPESPEVAREADKIRKCIKKCNLITGICWDEKSRYATRENMKGINLVKLPLKVLNVYSRGKLIIFLTEDKNKEKTYLVSHLGMTGYWTLEKRKYSN